MQEAHNHVAQLLSSRTRGRPTRQLQQQIIDARNRVEVIQRAFAQAEQQQTEARHQARLELQQIQSRVDSENTQNRLELAVALQRAQEADQISQIENLRLQAQQARDELERLRSSRTWGRPSRQLQQQITDAEQRVQQTEQIVEEADQRFCVIHSV